MQLTYTDQDTTFTHRGGVRWRGNISLTFPKKNYDIEFWADDVGQQSADVRFPGMRNDDDWILDALYNEPLRMRSVMANGLWKDLQDLPRASDTTSGAPKDSTVQPTTIAMKYVQVYLNDELQGVYALHEQVDRKQLKLKKHKGDTIRGQLFKAAAYNGGPGFFPKANPPENLPAAKNILPHWSGWEAEYPEINYAYHWDDLTALTELVVNSDNTTFASQIEETLDLDNAIDYYLLINLLRATDNRGKNYYLARKDADTKWFFVPWDLDGVLGTIIDGRRIPTTDDIMSNRLFDRLIALNPGNFNQRVSDRWMRFRESVITDQVLQDKIQSTYDQFVADGIYAAEAEKWPGFDNHADHLDYLQDWLQRRLQFLDHHFTEFRN